MTEHNAAIPVQSPAAQTAARPNTTAAKPTNHSALWSMIFGIFSLVFLGLNPFFPVIAIVLALVSKAKHGKKLSRQAAAGLIMGIIGFLLAVLWIIFFSISGISFILLLSA